ncbi:MAG TPA: hypothetical protein VIG33_14820 [Pseudobdellovibrionaceae bacterium]|jgi:hypothetical protein
MLEGKEAEGSFGGFGGYSVDITDKGLLEIGVSVRIDLVAEAKKLAEKTATPIDDTAIAWLEKLMSK